MGRAGELTAGRRWIDRAGPLLVLPAIFLFAYAVAWRLSSPRNPLPAGAGELSNATSQGAPEDVGGFVGRLDVAGGMLHARLVPLQSAPAWQAFDAQALAERLGVASGEPWRLELSFEAAPGPGLPGDIGATTPAAPLVLGEIWIESGARGRARLAQIDAPETDGSHAVDPVRTLLARRADELQPGASIEVVLLGAPPAGSTRLQVTRSAADGGPLSLELLPARVRTDDLARSLARAGAKGGDARAR